MSKKLETQVLVIGAGPGGYAAAFRAADLGLQTTLVSDEKKLGGVCLLCGCIPSKALLHTANVINEAREFAAHGVSFGRPKINLDELRAWKDGIIEQLASGISGLAKQRQVNVVHGKAVFIDSQRVHVEGNKKISQINYQHAILASGSRPVTVPGLELDSPRLMDSTSALALETIPKTLLVVGGGYIGLELGTVYAALGSKVTVVELTDGLLPGVDRDLVRPVHEKAASLFEAIILKTKVESLKETRKGIQVKLGGEVEKQQMFERVLIAVGRRPNSDGIALENTGVKLDRHGFVRVDAQRRTDDPNIFAIGDVAGEPMLAHKAHHEGHVVAEVIAGQNVAYEVVTVPAVVFTDPEIAWCGLTETEASTQGVSIAVGRFPWAASGRARALGSPDGLTKIVFDPQTKRVLGVGIVGRGAGELIAEGVVALEMGALAEDIALSIHPHPTLSETVAGAAQAFLGTVTDILNVKRKTS